MTLNPDACYRALVAHDARFDGAFFVGVRTTGIYCRPVCRAKTPGRNSCVFFTRAALAEQAGFRACLRCRPERAPGHASVDAVSRLVTSAIRRIEEGALNDHGVEDLASSLGVSARHLRRAMQDELGIGPTELALSRRIALARELLRGTSLPIIEIAFASGFSSVRRFNAAYRASQRMTPSEMRRPATASASSFDGVRIVLDVRPPFDAEAAFAFLGARLVAGAETFENGVYRRATVLGGRRGVVAISPGKGDRAIAVEVSPELAPSLMTIAARVRRVFDTDADPRLIAEHLARDPALRARVRARPGLRVMGAFDPFEWAARAVLGQQVSVRAARTLAARLVVRFGTPVDAPGLTHAFPDAARLAEATESEIAAIGLTRARARTLSGLARAVARGELVLDASADPAALRETLLALPGFGPWTCEYVAMRALGWPDAFPAGDLGLRRALGGISAAEIERRSKRWSPWRAYAAAHLWTGSTEVGGSP